MLIVDALRAKYYQFIFAGIQHRHYELLKRRVDILERENALQKECIKWFEDRFLVDRKGIKATESHSAKGAEAEGELN